MQTIIPKVIEEPDCQFGFFDVIPTEAASQKYYFPLDRPLYYVMSRRTTHKGKDIGQFIFRLDIFKDQN